MNPYDLSMSVLHTFLDTARAYLDSGAQARYAGNAARRTPQHVPFARRRKPALLELEYRKNAPA